MKKLALSLLTVPFVFSSLVSIAEQIKLEEGTPVRLRVVENVSSSSNRQGDTVSLIVAEDILGNDNKSILIKAGTTAYATITQSEERGRLGKKGQVSLSLESTKATDGTRVWLRGNNSSDGKDKVGSTVALSLIVSPLFLLKRGSDATIPSGATFTGKVDRDYFINVERSNVESKPLDVNSSTSLSNTGTNSTPDYLQKYVK